MKTTETTSAARSRADAGAGGLLPYRPALDGVRAIAVIAVFAYHLGLPMARGGFLGVDIFFVLSGYLITSLLLSEHDRTGHIDLLRFWVRRARRLLPALLLALLAVAVWCTSRHLTSRWHRAASICRGRCSTEATGI
jgi:peptidoglycan/LPS O-acetylase OafA/YrhL